MAVSPKTLAAVKAASLSSVIEATGASLKKVGHEFLTKCLWHEDTNPSLTISDNKGFCYCHVCLKGGDAIDYIMERYGLGWREAVEKTASILDVPFELDGEDPEEAAKRYAAKKSAIALLQKEQDTYSSNLRDPRATRIKKIWTDRGLTKEAALEFGAGFAPTGFFAGRITLPIYDHQNNLVGFTGRACNDQPAKYKNSADSDLFQKKQLVFNESRAKEAARETGSLIFVEGHLDVVSMWCYGIKNVVALQGTSSPDPLVLQRLTRNIKNIILCFDGDAGGRKAAEHFLNVAGPMALAGSVNINVVTLPEGKDPDEVIRSGENLYNYLASAPSWLDWVIDTWAAALDKNDTSMITDVEAKLRGLIDGLRSRALRTHYIDKAARVLTSTEKEAEKLAKEWGNRQFFQSADSWKPRSPAETRLAAERRLLRLYVHRPSLREQLRPLLGLVQNPALLWLSHQLRLLDEYCASDLTPHSAMAIVAVAEPHYMNQLRSLIRPNVIIDDDPGVIDHLAIIMEREVLSSRDELDANQPPA